MIDPASGELIDEALCTVMRGPRSYTGEDVVEISCHGSPVVLRRVLSLLRARGVRLAEPGEFTRRAYENGRLDLAQAEAVVALIGARTERAAALAVRSLSGGLSERLARVRERLLDLVAGLEVALDFPDEHVGLEGIDAAKTATELAEDVEGLLHAVGDGRIIQEGLTVVIVGAANAGKSSLLNRLLESDRAIVSPTPGTTRDVIEGWLTVDGVPVRLIDTAGLGETSDPIEAEGMRRAMQVAERSDLALVVVDGHRPELAASLPALASQMTVINKADLPQDPTTAGVEGLRVSALTGQGIDALSEALRAWVGGRLSSDAEEAGLTASVRQIAELESLRESLGRGSAALAADVPIEAALVDLRAAMRHARAVVGADLPEIVLDRIFSTFCLGK